MSYDPPHDFTGLGGEELRNAARRQDKLVGLEIERLRQEDPTFRTVLGKALALDDEIARRKNK